jgi:hypothetical protein
MTYDPVDRYAVLFGGCGQYATFSDTWTFSSGVWKETSGYGPSGREYPSMVFDPGDGYVLLYGGDRRGIALNDTWSFSHGNWTELNGTPNPPARTRAAASYDVATGSVLVFGGYNTTDFVDVADTWEFSGGHWAKVTPTNGTKPAPRDTATMAYDAADRESVLFGGFSTKNLAVLNDTWTFASGTWTLRSLAGPTPRAREAASALFDTDVNATVVFGGDWVFGTLNDLWEFNSSGWTQLGFSGPPAARVDPGFVWDTVDDYGILFGGNETPLGGAPWAVNDTFSLGPNFTASLQILPAVIDLGQNSTLVSRTVSNGTPSDSYAYSALPPGCSTADSSDLLCTPTSVGAYRVVVDVTASWGSVHASYRSNASLVVHASPTIVNLTATPPVISYGEGVTITATPSGGTGRLSYLYSGLPPGCPDSPLSTLTCTPYGSVAGGYPHTFRINATVTDSLGEENSSSVSLTINPDPSVYPGSFVADPAVTDIGMVTQFSATASGGTGPLSFNYSGLPPGCSSQNRSTLSCRPLAAGTYAVGLVLTDASGYTTPPVLTTLTVQPPPNFSSLTATPGVVEAGQQVIVNANASGGTGGLMYSYVGLPKGCDSGGNPQFLCTPSAPGNYTIVGTAVDSVGGNASASTTLRVVAAPAVSSFSASPQTIDVGQSFALLAEISGGSGPFSYAYTGLPPGCTSANLSGLSCATTPQTKAGSFSVHLAVTDAFGVVATSVVVVQVNSDPHLLSFTADPAAPALGESTSLSVRLAGGTPPFAYGFSGLPTGCASNDSATLACRPDSTGNFRITVLAEDGAGFPAYGNVTLVVGNATALPPPGDGIGTAGTGLPLAAWAGILGAALSILLIALVLRRRRGPPDEMSEQTDPPEEAFVAPDEPYWEHGTTETAPMPGESDPDPAAEER